MGDLYLFQLSGGPMPAAKIIGDLKLFEPKTMCPLIAVRDREER
jgi:hypothetical protein